MTAGASRKLTLATAVTIIVFVLAHSDSILLYFKKKCKFYDSVTLALSERHWDN